MHIKDFNLDGNYLVCSYRYGTRKKFTMFFFLMGGITPFVAAIFSNSDESNLIIKIPTVYFQSYRSIKTE